MNTKILFKNLAILLFFSIGFFSIYSFNTTDSDASDLITYDQSYYQDMDSNDILFNFADTTNDKCGGDKKSKDTKDSKCGDGEVAKDSTNTKDAKCGEGKCGDDKKTDKDKENKCGEG